MGLLLIHSPRVYANQHPHRNVYPYIPQRLSSLGPEPLLALALGPAPRALLHPCPAALGQLEPGARRAGPGLLVAPSV